MSDNQYRPYELQDFSELEEDSETDEGTDPSESGEAPPTEEQEEHSQMETRILGFSPLNFGEISETPPNQEEFTQAEEDEKIEKSETFRNDEFTPENSLLTDVESYAKTVREGADIYSQRKHDEADQKMAEAQKKHDEAEQIRQEALEEKERMIAEAQAEVEAIKAQAYQEGFEVGQQEGAEQRYTELAPQVAQVDDLLAQLSQLRQIVRFQTEQEMLQLAVLVAKKVVHEELTINQDVLVNIAKVSLQEIEALGKIQILVNPNDYDLLVNSKAKLEQYLKEEQRLVIQPNIDAEPGALLVETDETIVNFHFEKQFEAIEDALSRKLSDRQAHLYEVDMDAYDFSPPPELDHVEP